MSTSKFASSFAPYTPPPDDPSYEPETTRAPTRSWRPHASHTVNTSYQSGGIPTFSTSMSSEAAVVEGAEVHQNQWETRYGMRVDMLAASAYLLGPITALLLLILETQNDYVRFHAYQSALMSAPLVLLRIFASLAHFPPWLQTCFTLLLVLPLLYMAFRAYRDASQNGLVPYHLPRLGQIADQWVQEE